MVILENILDKIIFLEIVVGISVWFYWAFSHKKRIGYAFTPLFFLFHMLLFYILSELNMLSKSIYVIWRNLIFIHTLLVLILAGIIMTYLVKKGGK